MDRDPLDFDKETKRALTPHERDVCAQIAHWRSSDDSILQSIRKVLPWKVGEAAPAVPVSAREAVEEAILGGLQMAQDGSRLTFRASSILERARSRGLEASTVEDLRDAPLKRLDKLPARYEYSNTGLAAAGGGLFGLGGPGLAAAELPLLFCVSFRGVQQIGTCYGFEMDDPEVRPVVLGIFNAGAGASSTAKAALLADVHVAAQAFAKKWTYEKVAERTLTGAAAQTLKQMTKRLPQKIARKVTKQKLAQGLPYVGAVFGAGFNYAYVRRTLRSARMVFRSLYLTRKYGQGGTAPVLTAP